MNGRDPIFFTELKKTIYIYIGHLVLKAPVLLGLGGTNVRNLPPASRKVVSNGRIRDPKVVMKSYTPQLIYESK